MFLGMSYLEKRTLYLFSKSWYNQLNQQHLLLQVEDPPTSFIMTYTSDTDYIGTDSFAYTLTTASGDNDSANPDPIVANDNTASQ